MPSLSKSILHNLGVVVVGFAFGFVGRLLDYLLTIHDFASVVTVIVGSVLLTIGFLIRVWATVYFYNEQLQVISLVPQGKLITTGPYRFSRNPLYLGGNVFIFLGAVLVLGSPSGIVLTAINVVAVDFMIRREEKQLAQTFGEEWLSYTTHVRRWL